MSLWNKIIGIFHPDQIRCHFCGTWFKPTGEGLYHKCPNPECGAYIKGDEA